MMCVTKQNVFHMLCTNNSYIKQPKLFQNKSQKKKKHSSKGMLKDVAQKYNHKSNIL